MPKQAAVYTIPFGQRGMVAHPNRWLTQAGDLAIAENVTFENDMLEKEPAAAHYDTTGLAIESPYGTFSAATDSSMAGVWWPASSTAAFGASLASATANTASPWTVACGTSAAIGVVVVVAVGSSFGTTQPLATAVTDTKGNLYTRRLTLPGTASISANVELWTAVLTTGLTNTDTFTITVASAPAHDRSMVAASYTGVTTPTSEANVVAGIDGQALFSSATNTYVGRSYPALLVAAVSWLNSASTPAVWQGG